MGIWSRAVSMAEQTPVTRNRYVDFLRAMSILFVISGHWLIATAFYDDGSLTFSDMLTIQPWTQWLSWIFQVMPIFFIVGGFSNAISIESSRRKGVGYAGWLASRLHRLATPLIVLLTDWAIFAIALGEFGVTRPMIQLASQAALVPIWFLAIYMMVVVLAPLAYDFWKRWGFASFWLFVALAVAVDIAYLVAGQRWLGWTNYFWIWLAVHHLGFAWHDGRMGGPLRLLLMAMAGLAVLMVLIFVGPYPLAMAGSPDDILSNTLPPKVTLLALGIVQFGLLLAVEKPMQRLLENVRLWAGTVLISSMIMTVYLWHMTVLIIVIGVAWLLGGIGLQYVPGSEDWWQFRPVWLALLVAVLLPVALAFSGLERLASPAADRVPSAFRLITGAMLMCLGVALLSLFGFGGGPLQRFDLIAFSAVIIGAAISGLMPGLRRG